MRCFAEVRMKAGGEGVERRNISLVLLGALVTGKGAFFRFGGKIRFSSQWLVG